MTKEEIRRQVRARKTMLDAAEKSAAARRVFERVQKLAAFVMADRILMYHSLPDELSTREFIDSMAGTKQLKNKK